MVAQLLMRYPTAMPSLREISKLVSQGLSIPYSSPVSRALLYSCTQNPNCVDETRAIPDSSHWNQAHHGSSDYLPPSGKACAISGLKQKQRERRRALSKARLTVLPAIHAMVENCIAISLVANITVTARPRYVTPMWPRHIHTAFGEVGWPSMAAPQKSIRRGR